MYFSLQVSRITILTIDCMILYDYDMEGLEGEGSEEEN